MEGIFKKIAELSNTDNIFSAGDMQDNLEEINKLLKDNMSGINELLNEQRWLRCLEAAGVDNWEGHDIAVDMYEDDSINKG